MTQFLVEVFAPRSRARELAAAERRARRAAGRVSRNDNPVRYVRATYVPEDETCFYVFDAPSADVVARVGALAGLGDGRNRSEDARGGHTMSGADAARPNRGLGKEL